jgi:hypothetical protein
MLRYIAFLAFILVALPLVQAAWSISSRYDGLPYATDHRGAPVTRAQR